MKKSLNIFTFFSVFIVIFSLLIISNTVVEIFSFCLGIITYRFAIFNNWLGLKKYGVDNRHGKNADNNGE
jgi:hypothetical protein